MVGENYRGKIPAGYWILLAAAVAALLLVFAMWKLLQELVESGIVLSYPSSSAPGMGNAFTQEAVCLRTSRVNAGHQYAKTGFWTIPATSGNPEAAMRFLNLMYEDARVSNLIQWGIEGEHYEVVNEESMQIAWPEG